MDEEIKSLTNRLRYLETQRINQQQILPGAVQDRHLNGFMIHSGTDVNKPSSGATGVLAYFATDTFKLYIWTGSVYKSVTLT